VEVLDALLQGENLVLHLLIVVGALLQLRLPLLQLIPHLQQLLRRKEGKHPTGG
jgi:hypothetical protein